MRKLVENWKNLEIKWQQQQQCRSGASTITTTDAGPAVGFGDARTAGASANTTSPVPITEHNEKVSTPVITATPLIAPLLVGTSKNIRMLADEKFDPVVDGSETSSTRDGVKNQWLSIVKNYNIFSIILLMMKRKIYHLI